jgi:hypothetical protein
MRALVGIAVFTVVLGACSGGQPAADSQALECPTQTGPPHIGGIGPPPASFEVTLPDSGVNWNSGGEWILSVVPPQPAELTVLVTIEPDVVLESLTFEVQSVYGDIMWTRPAGTHLRKGTFGVALEADGTGWPRGPHPLMAAMEIEYDNRDPCRYGDRSEASWTATLGYLEIGIP